MKTVYTLWHEYETSDREEFKMLGIFSTKENAEEARTYFLSQLGFRDYPEGFVISEFEVDERLWSDGFVTAKEALEALD